MRHGRAKNARKTLKFLRLNFGLHPVYRVLCDGTFLAEAVRKKVPIKDRIGGLLSDRFEVFVLRSVVEEMKTFGDKLEDVVAFALNECTIIEDKKDSTSDGDSDGYSRIIAHVGPTNPTHYFIATQDGSLADSLRSIPCTCIMRLHNTVLCLENVSQSSKNEANKGERRKTHGNMSEGEKEQMTKVWEQEKQLMKRKRQEEEQEAGGDGRKRKKAKEPNPLASRKKTGEKVRDNEEQNEE